MQASLPLKEGARGGPWVPPRETMVSPTPLRVSILALYDPDGTQVRFQVAHSREEILEQVKGALSEKLGIEESEITEEASFEEDLGADSLDLVEVVMDLEDQFGLKIPDDDARELTTVGKAIDYVIAHQE